MDIKTALIVIGILLIVISFAFIVAAVKHYLNGKKLMDELAPEGWEDEETGFHYGKK